MGKPLSSAASWSATGPGGRDGYIHFADAMEILRMAEPEVSEIAVRVKTLGQVERVASTVRTQLASSGAGQGAARVEVHTWDQLSPFANVARMIDVMIFFIKLMLIAIVLISILNVMLMAVERVREIGTIAAIGTLPRKILALFLVEGFLGIAGAVVGVLVGLGVIGLLHLAKLSVTFGQGTYMLAPTIAPLEVLIASVLVIGVSLLASVQPAYKASRLEPIEALRHVRRGRRMSIVLFILVGVLCLATPAVAIEGSALLKQVDANLQPESFESYRKLINIEPSGAQREFLLYTLKKGQDKIASLFLAPASETGRPSGWAITCGCTFPRWRNPSASPACNRWWAGCSTMPISCAWITMSNTTCGSLRISA